MWILDHLGRRRRRLRSGFCAAEVQVLHDFNLHLFSYSFNIGGSLQNSEVEGLCRRVRIFCLNLLPVSRPCGLYSRWCLLWCWLMLSSVVVQGNFIHLISALDLKCILRGGTTTFDISSYVNCLLIWSEQFFWMMWKRLITRISVQHCIYTATFVFQCHFGSKWNYAWRIWINQLLICHFA